MKTIGTRIKELRLHSNLTHEELAEEIDFTKGIIWSYELDKKEPSIDHLIRFSNFFNVSLDYLIKGNKEKSIIELQNKSISENYSFVVDDTELTSEELIEIVAYTKAKRMIKEELL